MKVQTLILGEFLQHEKKTAFRLYRFPMPLSPPLHQTDPSNALYYYSLHDLDQLDLLPCQHASLPRYYRDYPSTFCKDNQGQVFASTKVLGFLAKEMGWHLLFDLCHATEHSSASTWTSLLTRIDKLTSISPSLQLVEQDLNPLRLTGQEFLSRKVLLANRLSPPTPQTANTMSSSLLLQRRLAPKQKTAHLTIHTPTYRDHHLRHTNLRSAPLRKSMSRFQLNRRLHQALAADGKAVCASPIRTATPARPGASHSFTQLQRNEFLQPFDRLYDTLEETKKLKVQLDDNIRQSLVLLTKFQARQGDLQRQIKHEVEDVFVPYLQTLDGLVQRLGHAEKTFEQKHLHAPTPAASVQSEIHFLMTRIDQLEKKLASKSPTP
ncbi:hypothetical protein DM01DRAFT_1298938 [Hesseltinella vesiculosa]|uniref:Uncharacterized protein n=1 Tax=Hesseltinella vesiculosa TaxID=101127 RepID=A0A1X2GW77_9FUNG|nr:hypothetical protein DM01DRAFT_1298938 [Hesseltinella vesiculosa]